MRTYNLSKIITVLTPTALLLCLLIYSKTGFRQPRPIFLSTFIQIFVDIFMESLPFVIAGALLSSLLHVFIPEEMIRRWIPKNPIFAIVVACVIGMVIPIFECGMIPLVRRLIQKGMPVYMAMIFILSGPIINPIVYSSTYAAFRIYPHIVFGRMGVAFGVSLIIGLILYVTVQQSPLKRSLQDVQDMPSTLHGYSENSFATVSIHTLNELFHMSKYLILGCLLTAGIQTCLINLNTIGSHPLGSYIFMMGFAFVLSLCSTSDAFIASTFVHSFSTGPLLAFLVMGPMLDFKNFLMLLSAFKLKFVLYLSFLIVTLVFLFSFFVDIT
ncbi:uncharacterized membrane protein YraQ (UPF0718 family) [Paenibacillus shirakamiensis]|uniref:Uncharacterized membrane protein YraQ (UPF0718 family) n=1 Tax=Paenibacillus shirakamiensis TaxID=1265935 RepID=A0ABS4JF89_9BACL|nr:permease [Paenibacillus shirakamiensis]MBP2000375.1 uncharacterized membrane protein YraQ (UPF0718 family) [Paenibacillus shirakamiensis]